MLQPQPLTRLQRALVVLLSAVAAAARFVPLSKTPWDWDEVLFCLAVRDYNVLWHYPHPPGFPLYIALGKIARLFADSDFHALQAINVIAAACIFPAVFWLARTLRLDFVHSCIAAFVVAFLPNVWFFGGTAFSDVPAMTLYLFAVGAFLGVHETNPRRYYAAAILLGAAMLIRPQNAFVAIFPWTVATLTLVRAKQWRTVIGGNAVLVLIGAIGYGTAAYVTGFAEYFQALQSHSRYVRAADSIDSVARPPLWKVFFMQLDPYYAGKVSLLVNLLALIAIVRGPRKAVTQVLLTFAPFFLFAMLVVNPTGTSRFSLNYVTGIMLLAAIGISVVARLAPPRMQVAISVAFVLLISGRFITWVLPGFEMPRKTASPPVAATMYVEQHAPKHAKIFVDESIWPWGHYYIVDHEQTHVFTPAEVIRDPRARDGWFVQMNASTLHGSKTFTRPRNRTWNLVTQRAFEATVMPATSIADFKRGWYDLEGDATNQWRWSKKRAWIGFPSIGNRTGELVLKFIAPTVEVGQPVSVTFTWNGQTVGTWVTKNAENTAHLYVRSRANGPNELRIDTSHAFVPKRLGLGEDRRQLGLMFQTWRWRSL